MLDGEPNWSRKKKMEREAREYPALPDAAVWPTDPIRCDAMEFVETHDEDARVSIVASDSRGTDIMVPGGKSATLWIEPDPVINRDGYALPMLAVLYVAVRCEAPRVVTRFAAVGMEKDPHPSHEERRLRFQHPFIKLDFVNFEFLNHENARRIEALSDSVKVIKEDPSWCPLV